MVISESKFNQILAESIEKCLNEQALKEMIKGKVRESIMSMGEMPYEESDDEKDDKPIKPKKNSNGVSDMNNETEAESEKRDQVEDFFDKPGVNNAQYAYRLFGVEPEHGKDTNDMKNARSQFEKDLNHETNDAGYPYSFTSAQVNKLQSMISNNQLSEAVGKAIEKVLKEDK